MKVGSYGFHLCVAQGLSFGDTGFHTVGSRSEGNLPHEGFTRDLGE